MWGEGKRSEEREGISRGGRRGGGEEREPGGGGCGERGRGVRRERE